MLSSGGAATDTSSAATTFVTIQTDAGTSPVADQPNDTLTLTSSDLTITGNSATDTVTFAIAAANKFPSGTAMLFQQTNAPTGWTKSTTHNDKALRVVSGAASSGGTVAFSTVFGKTATDNHTLALSAIPSHGSHGSGTSAGATGGDFTAITVVTNLGGGGAHSHGMDIRVQYVDLIIATKD